jgi:hypothetical protein
MPAKFFLVMKLTSVDKGQRDVVEIDDAAGRGRNDARRIEHDQVALRTEAAKIDLRRAVGTVVDVLPEAWGDARNGAENLFGRGALAKLDFFLADHRNWRRGRQVGVTDEGTGDDDFATFVLSWGNRFGRLSARAGVGGRAFVRRCRRSWRRILRIGRHCNCETGDDRRREQRPLEIALGHSIPLFEYTWHEATTFAADLRLLSQASYCQARPQSNRTLAREHKSWPPVAFGAQVAFRRNMVRNRARIAPGRMGMRGATRIIAIAAMAAVGATSAGAKAPPPQSPLVTALDQCRTITDPTQRLACFDKTSAILVAAARSGQVSVVDRGQLREARRSLFGFAMPKLPFFAGDESANDVADEIETTIKSAGSIGYGKFRIVLAQGNAVWETTETSISLRDPKPGQKISIKRGPMGSYFVRINGQRSVKGRRVG